MNNNSKKLFKKFSDFKNEAKKSGMEEIDPSVNISTDTDLPMNPNLSKETKKGEKFSSRKNIIPKEQNIDINNDEEQFNDDVTDKKSVKESTVETFGKVAKFPKNTKASKAYNFLENVKISN